ncbi:hypothetical protein IWQ60_011319 [Tieghemiomyces parasiticus]|uniref:Uncharacterized protein n=1 Tax=Tieghemiomyces parasiticus TaxID=78921 RepID=A0A9W7ZQR2_9FUNG|nr:hypothetical protein IWQ60_011319 [Tieghemiomyces parasiticus]
MSPVVYTMGLDALSVRDMSQTFTSLFTLIMFFGLFRAARTLSHSRRVIHIQSFLMNLFIALLSIPLNLWPVMVPHCFIYSILFYIIYLLSIAFLGLIVITKAYYASGFSRASLGALLLMLGVALAVHIVCVVRIDVVYNPAAVRCDITFEQSSFIASLALDIVFNFTALWFFLLPLYRAFLRLRTKSFMILIRDGMLFWISVTIFRAAISIAMLSPAVNDYNTIIIVISSK